MTSRNLVFLMLFGIPHPCLLISGLCLQWQQRQIYHRMGDPPIGRTAFFTQFGQPGINFPGPNVLEARIAALPADLQADIAAVRRRLRYWGRAAWLYMGYLVVMICLIRMFG